MQVTSVDGGHSFTPARPIATITGVNEQFPGQSFRNLSIPTSGIDKDGNIYIAVASQKAEGAPVAEGTTIEELKRLRDERGPETEAEGDTGSGADIVMFKSADGGVTYTGPVRVNQDSGTSPADQFQPWLAVTEKGQVDIEYFDRRNDPNNFFIDTYLSRSNDGGKTFEDTRVAKRLWDPRLNPPISVSGEFIGDYQGLAADDVVAIPFWNSTQDNSLPASNPEHSPYQEVYAARVPNTKAQGGTSPSGASRCLDKRAPRSTLKRRNVKYRGGRIAASGKSRDRGCSRAKARAASDRGGIRRVYVSIAKVFGRHGCRFLNRTGRLTPKRNCRRAILLPARGKRNWRLSQRAHLPRGKYRAVARAVDRKGNKERPAKRRNTIVFRVR
jgi:hypothetical protein